MSRSFECRRGSRGFECYGCFRAGMGARGRCVRGVRAAPPQLRLPAWKFDFSDVSSAPCHDRTARYMNSYPPLILHVHTAAITSLVLCQFWVVVGMNVVRSPNTRISIFFAIHTFVMTLMFFVLALRVSKVERKQPFINFSKYY